MTEHACVWPNGYAPGQKWICLECGERWRADRWDTDADDFVVLVWEPVPVSDRFTDDELAELLTEILFEIDPHRDPDETRRKVADVIARRAAIEAED